MVNQFIPQNELHSKKHPEMSTTIRHCNGFKTQSVFVRAPCSPYHNSLLSGSYTAATDIRERKPKPPLWPKALALAHHKSSYYRLKGTALGILWQLNTILITYCEKHDMLWKYYTQVCSSMEPCISQWGSFQTV